MKEQSVILLVFCLVSGTLSKPPPTFVEYKDSNGQYSFGYSAPSSARSEVRSLDGSTRGSYSYVDDAGVIQNTQYTADGANGFQVIATNLPQAPSPVVDTPEVAAARLRHLEAVENAAKLAAGIPEIQKQQEEKIDGKDIDTVVVENAASLAENGISRQSQVQSANSEANAKVSAQAQRQTSGVEKEAAVVENEGASLQGGEKLAEGEPKQSLQSEPRATQQSDVPVVTTSFVIPGTVNLHSRIELDRSAVPATRLPSKSSALSPLQSSLPQGSFDPSAVTPASTKMLMLNGNEKESMLIKMAPLPAAPMPSDLKDYKPQSYSLRYVPGVVAPSNFIAVPHAIGSSAIYPQYYSYHYLPYGIL